MINTFYRCIICSANEADYDELLAVRLVTFLMENAEAIMVVPHQLCTQVRDRLVELQREKVKPTSPQLEYSELYVRRCMLRHRDSYISGCMLPTIL
jgi:hypothetical protein